KDVFSWRVTVSRRFSKKSTAAAFATSSALCPGASPDAAPNSPLIHRMVLVIGSRILGCGPNSGSRARSKLSTTRCNTAIDVINDTWLLMVTSSEADDADWLSLRTLLATTLLRFGSIRTVAVAVYRGVTIRTKIVANANRATVVNVMIHFRRRRIWPTSFKSIE